MYARIIDQNGTQVVAEVVDFDPAQRFTPDIAALFQPAEPGMVYMARLEGDVWVAPPAPSDEPPAESPLVYRTRVSRPEFKLLFTQTERLAIKQARAYKGSDPTAQMLAMALEDFYEIIEDPSLTYVDLALPQMAEGMGVLVSAGILTIQRAEAILRGMPE